MRGDCSAWNKGEKSEKSQAGILASVLDQGTRQAGDLGDGAETPAGSPSKVGRAL